MSALLQASELCYYLPGPAKVGVVRVGGDEVCLIDSGNDKSAGRAIRKELDARGWRLRAIYNTHSHADHIGGNKYLQSQTGCRIYAPGAELAFTRHPILEPSFLYGGYPGQELRGKFLLAAESEAETLTPAALPAGFELLPLPGHSFDMVGFRTPDDVVFLADSLASRATLEKYRICFIYDVAAYLRTLEMVQSMSARLFIPSHAEPTEDIAPLARLNAEHVHATAATLLSLCRQPLSFEELLQRLFNTYGLSLNFEQYVLAGSTLRSYLTWLSGSGRIAATFADNRLLWAAC